MRSPFKNRHHCSYILRETRSAGLINSVLIIPLYRIKISQPWQRAVLFFFPSWESCEKTAEAKVAKHC